VGGIVEASRQHEELPELLLERHAREQVGHALGDRQLRVAIRRWLRRRERQGREQHDNARPEKPHLLRWEHKAVSPPPEFEPSRGTCQNRRFESGD
jgi:hypothetical protein